MPDTEPTNNTRERLLQAALEVFAEHGYRAATIREICGRAEANIAAVHYHFGDKRSLYEAIYGRLFETLRARRTAFLPADAPPEQRLRVHIQALLEELFRCDGGDSEQGDSQSDSQGGGWRSQRQVRPSTLFFNEMAHPTEVLDRIVTEHLEPDARELYEIVATLLETTTNDPMTIDCAASVIGQILYYHHATPIIERLHPHRPPIAERLDALVEQIWWFSLGGIERTKQTRTAFHQPALDDAADQGC
ncbi:MAG: CerR family C-terminal domain-containing protein [Halochromatium sp.]